MAGFFSALAKVQAKYGRIVDEDTGLSMELTPRKRLFQAIDKIDDYEDTLEDESDKIWGSTLDSAIFASHQSGAGFSIKTLEQALIPKGESIQISRKYREKGIDGLVKSQQKANVHCPYWMKNGKCKKGDKCNMIHDPDRKGSDKENTELTEEDKKKIAEEYLRKKRDALSTCGEVRGQQGNEKDDVYDDVYGDSNKIVGAVEEDDVYMGEA